MNTTATPTIDDIQEEDLLLEQETFSYSSLYDKLFLSDELILVIDTKNINKLKTGLSVAKNTALKKLKEAGIEDDGKKLKFIVIPSSKTNPIEDGQTMIKVILEEPKTGIVVHQIIVPEKEV